MLNANGDREQAVVKYVIANEARMLNWQHPSTAPKDTSWIAAIGRDGCLEGWTFEPKQGHWRVWSIPGFGERICLTTSGMAGWVRWSEVFEHMRETANLATV